MQRRAPLEGMKPSQHFFFLIGMFILCFILSNVLALVCMNRIAHLSIMQMEQLDFSRPEVLLATEVGQILGAIVVFFIPVIVYTALVSRNRSEYLTLNTGLKFSSLLIGGIAILVAGPLINYTAALNEKFPFPDFIKHLQEAADKEQIAFLKDQGISRLILNLFMIGVLAAVGEELFFRALLQRIFIKWTKSVHIGVWVTGIVFSMAHFEFLGFIPRMLLGVYLGYLFVWSGSIWVPIFAHFVNNASGVLISYLEDQKVVSKGIEDFGSKSGDITYVIVSTVLVGLMMFAIYRIQGKKVSPLAIS